MAPFPSPADDYFEQRVSLDDLIIHPSATYFIRNTGVAMTPYLHAGDILMIDRALSPLDGQIIVAIYQRKFLVRIIETHEQRIILKAINRAFLDIVVSLEEVEIWGVVTYCIRDVSKQR